MNKEEIISAIENLKVSEVKELVTMMEQHFGVKATATAVNTTDSEEVQATPSEVSVILDEVGTSKIAVIKAIAKITGKGLLDAKKMLDSVPVVVKEKVKNDVAEEIIKQLKEVGAHAIVK